MKKNWQLISFFVLTITLTIILLIATWLLKNNQNGIESVVIKQSNDISYEKEVIQDLSRYQEILNKYNIFGKLTNNDFKNNDYILDFIPYQKDLEIINIAVNIDNNGDVLIKYETNLKKDENSEKILINFIPIQKGILKSDAKISNNY